MQGEYMISNIYAKFVNFVSANKATITEYIFLVILGCYIGRLTLLTTMFSISWPNYTDEMFRYFLLLGVLLKLGYSETKQDGTFLGAVLAFSVFGMVAIINKCYFLAEIGLCILGCYGIDYKKILKVYLYIVSFISLVGVIASLCGAIPDLYYFNSGKLFYGHSFGSVFRTDFAAHLAFGAIVLFIVYDMIPIYMLVITAVLTYIAWYGCYSRCSTVILGMLIFTEIYYYYLRKYLGGKVEAYIKMLALIWLPVCCFSSILLTRYYNANNKTFIFLNNILTDRLILGNAAWLKYNISLTGTPFPMVGCGGSTISASGYNFVDCSYVMILIRYGLLILLAMVLLNGYLSWRAYKINNIKLLVGLSLIATHSIIEHHWAEIAYNALLLVVFSKMESKYSLRTNYNFNHNFMRLNAWVTGFLLALSLVCVPLIGYWRTLVNVCNLYWPVNQWKFFLYCLVFCISIFLLIRQCYILQSKVQTINKLPKLAIPIISLGIIIFLFCGAEYKIRTKQHLYQSIINSNTSIIHQIEKQTDAPVYVDDIPSLYSRALGKSYVYPFAGDVLAGNKKAVLLVPKRKEYDLLSSRGAVYAQIGENTGLYTANPEVIKLLKANRINISSVYDQVISLNLEKLSIINKLQYTPQKSIILNGEKQALRYGYELFFSAGKYKVEYKLKLHGSSLKKGCIAIGRVSTDWGKTIKNRRYINIDEFKNNIATITVEDIDIAGMGGEILLFPTNEAKLEVLSISYQKTGL